MSIDDFDVLQLEHDELSYPPNHTFDVRILSPTGGLVKRINHMQQMGFLSYFYGEKLLDVGCNKGFISFISRHSFDEILAIDCNSKFTDFGQKVCKAHGITNIKFRSINFYDVCSIPQKFDVVYFGQCSHYFMRDAVRAKADPLYFLREVKKIAKKYVIIDAAFTGDPSVEFDAKQDQWNEQIKNMATPEGYCAALRPEFKLIKFVWSGDGATRYIGIWERIEE